MTEEQALEELAPVVGTVIGMAIVVAAPDLTEDETMSIILQHVRALPSLQRSCYGHQLYKDAILRAAAIVEGRIPVR